MTKKPTKVSWKDFFPEEYKQVSSDDLNSEVDFWIDTGAYTLNLIVSGSIFKGMPGNRSVMLAGEYATGKTYIVMKVIKDFLARDPRAVVLFYDTEQANEKDTFESHGIDTSRVYVDDEIATIEEFGTKVFQFLEGYMTVSESEKRPVLIVCDSLGQLSTEAEMEGYRTDELKADAGRGAKGKKGAFRVIKHKQKVAMVPIYCTNHVYEKIGSYGGGKEVAGGSGPAYMSDCTLMLTRSKDRDGTEVIGQIIKVETIKSRFTRPFQKVEMHLNFEKGLDRYGGLLDLAVKFGLVKQLANKYEFPGQEPAFESAIDKNPEKYYTPEFLQTFENQVSPKFRYGPGEIIDAEVSGEK